MVTGLKSDRNTAPAGKRYSTRARTDPKLYIRYEEMENTLLKEGAQPLIDGEEYWANFYVKPDGTILRIDKGEVVVIAPEWRGSKNRKGLYFWTIKTWILLGSAVAQAFVPNPLSHKMIRFKDGDPHNVCADNIEWVTTPPNLMTEIVGCPRPS
jgi:hypothetical protein